MKRAIISVSNKENIIELSQSLINNGFEIYSTGGTYRLIKENLDALQIPFLKEVSELTGFPEILNGRVKTLHPHIYAGLLADTTNEEHMKQMAQLNLSTIDLVVCNLYPFQSNNSIENIDIGGVTLLRASGKNHESVVVLSNPDQYNDFMRKHTINISNYRNGDGNESEGHRLGHTLAERQQLAHTCFTHVSQYDTSIASFLNTTETSVTDVQLKYGMNPHQKDTQVLFDRNQKNQPFNILNGTMGMINIIDMIHGWLTVKEVDTILNLPCAISMKHTSLAGLGVGSSINETSLNYFNLALSDTDKFNAIAIAYMKSRLGDPLSSFGDFICISREVDALTAKLIKSEITDGICAPSFTPEAFEILKTKKNGGFKIIEMDTDYYNNMISKGWVESKQIYGMTLSQPNNNHVNHFTDITDENLRIDYVLANTALKYAQSNNISMAVNGQIIGIGCGQQNRVGCVKLAGDKATNWLLRQTKKAHEFWDNNKQVKKQPRINLLYDHLLNDTLENVELENYNIVMSSDGFFPFNDNIVLANKYGVKNVVHPGGSINDDAIAQQCLDLNMNLSVTGYRMFYH